MNISDLRCDMTILKCIATQLLRHFYCYYYLLNEMAMSCIVTRVKANYILSHIYSFSFDKRIFGKFNDHFVLRKKQVFSLAIINVELIQECFLKH